MATNRDNLMSFSVSLLIQPDAYSEMADYTDYNLRAYESTGRVSEGGSRLLQDFISLNMKGQREFLNSVTYTQDKAQSLIRTLLEVIGEVQGKDVLQKCAAAYLDGLLVDERSLVDHLIALYRHPKSPVDIPTLLKRIILPEKGHILFTSGSHILAIFLTEILIHPARDLAPLRNEASQLQDLLIALSNDARIPSEVAVYCLLPMFKLDFIRKEFLSKNGARSTILSTLKKRSGQIQPVYSAICCLWLLSLDQESEELFRNKDLNTVHLIVKELKRTEKEKIIRVALATLKNITQFSDEITEMIIDQKALEGVDNISRRVLKDPDVIELVREVGDILQSSIKVLSSFEKWLAELDKGALVPGITHTEAFWKENARALEHDKYSNIRKLMVFLESDNFENVYLALNDIGEFARFHPYGKTILDKLGAKTRAMQLLQHQDPRIKEAALLCVQKIMLHNWQGVKSN